MLLHHLPEMLWLSLKNDNKRWGKNTTKEKRKGRGEQPQPETLTDGPVSLPLAWTRAARLHLPGYELFKHLSHMCTADWCRLPTKRITEAPSGANWTRSQLSLTFKPCAEPKPVLKYLACQPVVEQGSKKDKRWNGSSLKRFLSKEPFCWHERASPGGRANGWRSGEWREQRPSMLTKHKIQVMCIQETEIAWICLVWKKVLACNADADQKFSPTLKVFCKTDLIQSILKATDRLIWTWPILDKVPEETSWKISLSPRKLLSSYKVLLDVFLENGEVINVLKWDTPQWFNELCIGKVNLQIKIWSSKKK